MWLILTNRMEAERKGHFLTRHLRMCVYVCSRVHLPFCTFSFCLQCAGYVVTLKPSVNDTRAIFLCYSLGEKEIPEPPLRGVNQPKTTDLESKWVRKFHCIKTLRVVFFFSFFDGIVWHVVSSFPSQGLNLSPLQWKRRVLTTGLPGKFCIVFSFKQQLSCPKQIIKMIALFIPSVCVLVYQQNAYT